MNQAGRGGGSGSATRSVAGGDVVYAAPLLSLQFAVQHTELPFCVRVLSGNVSPLAGDAGAVGTS